MLATMKREVFDSVDDAALAWACFEPIIPQIRGKAFTVKSQVYKHVAALRGAGRGSGS
jgi:hypothetical protein